MTTAAKKKDTDAKDEAPVEAPEPVLTTEVTFDGTRAIDSLDGVAQEPREASFAEQVAKLAPEILSSVVRTVPWATAGDVAVDESTLTITLYR